jgi:DNA-binding FadR family transcriptional regulator
VLRPARYARLSDDIGNQIRRIVAHGRLRPGNMLPSERDLASLMNCSRGAVRDALRRLEQSGLVELRRGRGGGTFVAWPSSRVVALALSDQYYLGGIRLAKLIEGRVALESQAVRLATERALLGDFNALQSEIDIAEQVWQAGTWAERPDAQLNFHMVLTRTVENLVLAIVMEAMLRIGLQFTGPVGACLPRETVRFRRKLLRQMQARDADGAVATLRDYLTNMLGRCRDEVAIREEAELEAERRALAAEDEAYRQEIEEMREMARREGWDPDVVDHDPFAWDDDDDIPADTAPVDDAAA